MCNVVVCVATCMYVHLWFGVGHNVCIGGAISAIKLERANCTNQC